MPFEELGRSQSVLQLLLHHASFAVPVPSLAQTVSVSSELLPVGLSVGLLALRIVCSPLLSHSTALAVEFLLFSTLHRLTNEFSKLLLLCLSVCL